jgi:hypothetical protein
MTSNSNDFIVYDMPSMLNRRVTRQDTDDPNKWISDEAWYESVRKKMSTLFAFYKEHGLLRDPSALRETDHVILRISDFSEVGRKFLMTTAADKWLASFDKPGSTKDLNDITYLERQLARIEAKKRK